MEIMRNLIHTDLSLIKEFRDEAISLLKTLDYDEDTIFKVRLILDELIINSYKHGNNKEFDKLIDVIMLIDDNNCMIKVTDEGEGIYYKRPSDQLSDHGRGIHLVKTLADNLLVVDNTVVAFLALA